MRILVATEPRSYREAFVAVLRAHRPGDLVVEVAPEALAADLGDAVDLVLCSRLTDAVSAAARGWIELYPDGGSSAVSYLRGLRTTYPQIDLDTLLELVETAENDLPQVE